MNHFSVPLYWEYLTLSLHIPDDKISLLLIVGITV